MTPGGVRIGTPAVTTRGYLEKDMRQVGKFLDHLVTLSKQIQEKSGKKLKDFEDSLKKSEEVRTLGNEVEEFATQFDIPGFDPTKIDV